MIFLPQSIQLPVISVDGETWILLSRVDKKIVFRADSIDKNKNRVPDPSGHRMDEAVAEGSVKCRPKRFLINV